MRTNGFTDKPIHSISEDVFGIKPYINGLTDFVSCCNTPMTIAIQGDWGSGKTSMMNLIRENLNQSVYSVWFNTWQYSQFNMENDLSISFLQQLLDSLDVKDDTVSTPINNTLNLLRNSANVVRAAIKESSLIALDQYSGRLASKVEDLANILNGNSSANTVDAISKLKSQFQKCVNSKLENSPTSRDRVVFFIDDLDRLPPKKAVEILEVLNLFLDCENCVFILAIDYSVVILGVQQKYSDTIDNEKGKNFFDKIIQVPFKMPVAQYDVEKYVRTMLLNLRISYSEAEDLNDYVNLIYYSIGCNPRAIKRLFNAFFLLSKIYTNNNITNSHYSKLLFAILCLQQSFEPLYNYLMQNRYKSGFEQTLSFFQNSNFYLEKESIHDDLLVRYLDQGEHNTKKIWRFMLVFNSTIKEHKEIFSSNDMEEFLKVLDCSLVTSTISQTDIMSDMAPDWKSYNREVMISVNQTLKKEFNHINFHSKTNKNASTAHVLESNTWFKFSFSKILVNVDFILFVDTNSNLAWVTYKVSVPLSATNEIQHRVNTILENSESLRSYKKSGDGCFTRISNTYDDYIANISNVKQEIVKEVSMLIKSFLD